MYTNEFDEFEIVTESVDIDELRIDFTTVDDGSYSIDEVAENDHDFIRSRLPWIE
jgi:hypothetical protein